MASNFKIVAGNTAPTYNVTCTRNGTAIDLSSATAIDFVIYNKSTKTQTNSGHTTASILTASSGLVAYTAQAADFPSRGNYAADIRITWSGGGIEILYNQATWRVRNSGV